LESFAVTAAGSGSSGAGGGVVSIVHPIHPEMTRTRRTNSRTGMPTANSCQPEINPGIQGEKKATRYIIATTIEMMKIRKP
jgi:hypothetical protein